MIPHIEAEGRRNNSSRRSERHSNSKYNCLKKTYSMGKKYEFDNFTVLTSDSSA